VFVALQLSAQTNEGVRLAVVPESADVSIASDLLMAQLSGQDGIRLVEREEILRLYHEQGMSAAQRDDLKLGRLLGADGLLLLGVSKTEYETNLAIRLVAVKPGVVLTGGSFPWPLKDAAQWTESVRSGLDSFLPKLTVLSRNAIPISVVNLRSAVSTAETLETERQLKVLTIQRLSREREFFVMERQRMQLLSDEKLYHADDSAFWKGSYLLEGVVDQNGYSKETVTINARLTPAKGGAPVLLEAGGSRTNLAAVVNQLAWKISAALKVNSTVKEWNAQDEAAQYYEEAQWALRWGIYKEAEAAADSAWALGKRDLACAQARVKACLMEMEAWSVHYQKFGFLLARGMDAEGRLIAPMPTPEEEAEIIRDLRKEHRLIAGLCVFGEGYAREIHFEVADRLPGREYLGCAGRAAELCLEFVRTSPGGEMKLMPRSSGSTDRQNSESYQMGLEVVASVSKVLRDFQTAPTARKAYQNELATVRAGVRELVELMTNSASIRESYYVGGRLAESAELYHALREQTTVFGLMTAWGCFWQESPEETVRMYRRLLGSDAFCYLHDKLWRRELLQPRLVAWTEGERQSIPSRWEAFVGELGASTNLLWRLEGHALALTDISDESQLGIAFTNFFEEILTNRDALVANPTEVVEHWDGSLLARGWLNSDSCSSGRGELSQVFYREFLPKLQAMRQEYADKTVAACKAAAVFEKQKEFLRSNQPYDFIEFQNLFREKGYNRQQALEILPLIASYKSNLLALAAPASFMQRVAADRDASSVAFFLEDSVRRVLDPSAPQPQAKGGPKLAVTPPPGLTSAVAPTEASKQPPGKAVNVILVEKFLEIPPLLIPNGHQRRVEISAHQWVDGKLVLDMWCDAEVFASGRPDDGGESSYKCFPAVAILDARMKWQVFPCLAVDSQAKRGCYHRTTFWRGEWFTSVGGKVWRRDARKGAWEALLLPEVGDCELFCVSDHLYATTPTVVMEISEGGAQSRILASSRRRPAVSVLDTGELAPRALFPSPGGRLRGIFGARVMEWDDRDWKVIGAAPNAPLPPALCDEGLLLFADGWNSRAGIWRLTFGSDAVECCFEQYSSLGGVVTARNSEEALSPAWRLPKGYALQRLPATSRGRDLYLLASHAKEPLTVTDGKDVIMAKKMQWEQGYHAELFCFSSNSPTPLKACLRFADHEGVAPPVLDTDRATGHVPPWSARSWLCFGNGCVFFGREPNGSFEAPDPYMPRVGVWCLAVEKLDAEIARQRVERRELQAKAEESVRLASQALLAKYDHNHNGRFDAEEREEALDDAAYIASELETIDVNHNGLLDKEELAWFDANQNKSLDVKEQAGIQVAQHLLARILFERFDDNGDGMLDWAEMEKLQQSILTAEERLHMQFLSSSGPGGRARLSDLEQLLTRKIAARLPQSRDFTPMKAGIRPGTNGIPFFDARAVFKARVESYWRGDKTVSEPKP
jgi:TolB-like protein